MCDYLPRISARAYAYLPTFTLLVVTFRGRRSVTDFWAAGAIRRVAKG
jgi:hypothetical protein